MQVNVPACCKAVFVCKVAGRIGGKGAARMAASAPEMFKRLKAATAVKRMVFMVGSPITATGGSYILQAQRMKYLLVHLRVADDLK
jgi:hypothetical protein